MESFDQNAKVVTYSDGLVADAVAKTVTKNGRLIRQGNDMLIPAVWVKESRELIAYSENGYAEMEWTLPEDWTDVQAVNAGRIKYYGVSETETIPVIDGKIKLSLTPKTMLSIVPANQSF